MHACGHDGHTTMLLGAAEHLEKTRRFSGTVNLIFQPAEETGSGARAMIEAGVLDRYPCDAIFALHNHPGAPAGSFRMRAGPLMAGSDSAEVIGRGGRVWSRSSCRGISTKWCNRKPHCFLPITAGDRDDATASAECLQQALAFATPP